jgi:riboflavin biosynthesis pyrimidine reductase
MNMATWIGPGSPFQTLFSAAGEDGIALGGGAQTIYGEWVLPGFEDRPYVYVNFVTSRDGRVSFNIPGAFGGGAVSRNNVHDQWLMGLLRARADAIMVGDNTLKLEPEHIWTAETIFPGDAAGFSAIRQIEGRQAQPLQVFVSANGTIPEHAAVLRVPALRIVIATTETGAGNALKHLGVRHNIDILACGDEQVDFHLLYDLLWSRYQVRSLLCEGGPRLYGSILRAGAIDEEFVTLSPIVIGNVSGVQERPGLVEGTAFSPNDAPVSTLLSVRKAGDYLFLRSRYR